MARAMKPTYTRIVDGERVAVKTTKWYAEYRENGKIRRVPGTLDKAETERLALQLEAAARMQKLGLPAVGLPEEPAEYLSRFLDSLRTRDRSDEWVAQVGSRLRKMLAGLPSIHDFTPGHVEKVLLRMKREDDASTQTRNHYITTAKQFGTFLVRERVFAGNPVGSLEKGNAQRDRRHVRRSASVDEFNRMVAAAADGRTEFTVSPADRVALYLTAVASGLRIVECSRLRPGMFQLGDRPAISLPAVASKRGRADHQLLPDWYVPFITQYLAGRPADAAIWPAKIAAYKYGARMIRRDLARARAAWLAEAADPAERADREASDFLLYRDARGRVFDFHAIRGTFITRLAEEGLPLSVVQALARHSDPKLTTAHYIDHGLDLKRAELNRVAGPRLPTISGSGPV